MNNFFSHDSNARNSDKIINLRAKMGVEGYGIYFMILERLREEPQYMSVKDYNMLAFDFRVDAAKVKAVVENFGLFAFADDGKCFYSESFMVRMQFKDEKSRKSRESALKRWGKSVRIANAMRTQCERNASKEKEIKDNISSNESILSSSLQSKDFREIPPLSPLKGETEQPEIGPSSDTNPERKEKVARKRKELDLSFVEPSFQPIMADWLAYKSERGQTYRQKGVEGCYSHLKNLSGNDLDVARKIVEQSIANNYAGLFALKTRNHGSPERNYEQGYRSIDDTANYDSTI